MQHPTTDDAHPATEAAAHLVAALLTRNADPAAVNAELADLYTRTGHARTMTSDNAVEWVRTIARIAGDEDVVTTLAVVSLLVTPNGPPTYTDYLNARASVA